MNGALIAVVIAIVYMHPYKIQLTASHSVITSHSRARMVPRLPLRAFFWTQITSSGPHSTLLVTCTLAMYHQRSMRSEKLVFKDLYGIGGIGHEVVIYVHLSLAGTCVVLVAEYPLVIFL